MNIFQEQDQAFNIAQNTAVQEDLNFEIKDTVSRLLEDELMPLLENPKLVGIETILEKLIQDAEHIASEVKESADLNKTINAVNQKSFEKNPKKDLCFIDSQPQPELTLKDSLSVIKQSTMVLPTYPRTVDAVKEPHNGSQELEYSNHSPHPYDIDNDGYQSTKLSMPLALMLPSKYKDADVKEVFPEFQRDKPLRFLKLFGAGKPSSLPQIWRGIKRRNEILRKENPKVENDMESKRESGWHLDISRFPVSIDQVESDEEEKMMQIHENPGEKYYSVSKEDDSSCSELAPWRYGPAKHWYDMLNVPKDGEGFDYGFKLKEADEENISSEDNSTDYPDESYLMVNQIHWEDDIIWDGNEKRDIVLNKLYKKDNPAGWIPTSLHRTWSAYNKEARIISPVIQSPKKNAVNEKCTNNINKSKTLELGVNPECWWSILPLENDDLVNSRWEDDIIWDSEAMPVIPKPRLPTLDLNDENIVFEIPDEPSSDLTDVGELAKESKDTNRKSRLLLGKTGVAQSEESPEVQKIVQDPFNISNDEYYSPRITQDTFFKISINGNLIQHSLPAVEIQQPYFPTYMGPFKRSHFHRPPLKRFSHGALSKPGFHGVFSLHKQILKKAELREQERKEAGGGEIFFMRKTRDLTAKDGELVLMEYTEEHPPLVMQVGMATKIKNYYKRKPAKDTYEPEYLYGDTAYAHTSPFLGTLTPGQSIQTLENNLFRAPIYKHDFPGSDFLIIRTRQHFYIRPIRDIFTVGQELPLFEVPCPKSKKAQNFIRDFLQAYIYRLFWKSKDNPRRIKMEDIRKAFPSHSETSIRRRLNICADFKRTGGSDSNWWVLKSEFRLPNEDEIQAMVTPEECCAFYSMMAAEQRLKDAGYGGKSLFAPENDNEDELLQIKIDDEIKAAPWNTTRAFISAMNGKCLLQLTGVADPTGCGEGFSYVRIPNKPQLTKEEFNIPIQSKKSITGTDADLRRLSLSNAKQLLRKFNVPETEIRKLSRWEIIDVVRTLSTQQAKSGEETISKFARGSRLCSAGIQEKYKEECQRLFDLQNLVLSSNEILSTDEETSSEDDSDIEEMGKNLEDILSDKKTSSQFCEEREELERQELQKMITSENTSTDDKNKNNDLILTEACKAVESEKILKIYRTFRNADGKEFSRIETVRNTAVIEAYVRIRKNKNQGYMNQFGSLLDERQKEEIKKERRRIQDQLRRIKRNEQKGNTLITKKKTKKEASSVKVKCGACGGYGHMKTNKICPYYVSTSPVKVEMIGENEEKESAIEIEEDNLVKVDETKLVISKKLIQHADEVRRKSLVLKFKIPKRSGTAKKRKHIEEEYIPDTLEKPTKTINRRRADPLVVLSIILENILNDMKNIPDSQPFWYPVNSKKFPDYKQAIKYPMDLQTMRDKVRQKKYENREEFLRDVNQILENSNIYNGPNSIFSFTAQKMVETCLQTFTKDEKQLMQLECAINPFLGDDNQVQLSYLLETIVTQDLKTVPESWPFHKSVTKKFLKDNQMMVKNPIDLDTILNNIKSHKYQDRIMFRNDVYLLLTNSIAYNGPDSQFTRKAREIVKACDDTLNRCSVELTRLELAIKSSQRRVLMEDKTSINNKTIVHGESSTLLNSEENTDSRTDTDDDTEVNVAEVVEQGEYEVKCKQEFKPPSESSATVTSYDLSGFLPSSDNAFHNSNSSSFVKWKELSLSESDDENE